MCKVRWFKEGYNNIVIQSEIGWKLKIKRGTEPEESRQSLLAHPPSTPKVGKMGEEELSTPRVDKEEELSIPKEGKVVEARTRSLR